MIVRAGDHAISSPRGYRADSTIANRRRHPFSSAHRYCRRPRSVSLHVQASTFSPRRWTSQSSGLSATARGVQDSSFPAIAEAFYGRPAASAHRFPICSRRTPLSPGCPKIPDNEVREFNSGNRDLLERRSAFTQAVCSNFPGAQSLFLPCQIRCCVLYPWITTTRGRRA